MEIERQGAPNFKCGPRLGIPSSYWRTSSSVATGSMQHLQPSWRTTTAGNMGHMGQRIAPLYSSCSGVANNNGKSWGAGLPLRENNISKSSAPAGGAEHMAPPGSNNIAIALRQASPLRQWKDESTALLRAGSPPGARPRASDDDPNADQIGQQATTTAATSGTLSSATSTPRRARPSPLSSPPVAEAAPTEGEEEEEEEEEEEAGIQDSQREESPLGFMFRPELDKAGVVAAVSEIFCRPGFTIGPDDERRLKRSVESGRIDVHNMSRLLRWLAGSRAARELGKRGVEFVAPRAQPYTCGQGMTRLVEEVLAHGHPAGSNFIVCFSSRFDACSGAIRGRLMNEVVPVSSDSASDAPTTAEPGPSRAGGGRSAAGEDATRASGSSVSAGIDRIPRMPPQGDRTRHAAAAKGKKMASKVRRGVSTTSGVRTAASGSSSRNSRSGMNHERCGTTREGRVVALLLDEKPRHRHCGGGSSSSSGSGGPAAAAGSGDDEGEGVRGMRVAEWVDAWGECDGPMLAAWVFPGDDQHVAARQ